MTRPTNADSLADAKRAFRPGYTLISLAWVLTYFAAMNILARPGFGPNARLFCGILPIPLMVLGYWSWIRYSAKSDELIRRLEEKASLFAFRGSIFVFSIITLVVALRHQPTTAARSLGLVELNDVWQAVFLIPTLLYGLGFIIAHRKLFPRK